MILRPAYHEAISQALDRSNPVQERITMLPLAANDTLPGAMS